MRNGECHLSLERAIVGLMQEFPLAVGSSPIRSARPTDQQIQWLPLSTARQRKASIRTSFFFLPPPHSSSYILYNIIYIYI